MGWRPQLNTWCSRCRRSHGPFDVCVSGSSRKRSLTLKLSFGKCPKCKKSYRAGGPLTHDCAPRSDFKKRRTKFTKEQKAREREKARKARPKHDYTECGDDACKRALCVAHKSGITKGDEQGFERGWRNGYDRGIAECPRKHE